MASDRRSSGCSEFEALLEGGGVREVILATNPTVEGEATAHFFSELVRARGIAASRIAHGVPVGGELEYVDGGTLAHAMAGRQALSLRCGRRRHQRRLRRGCEPLRRCSRSYRRRSRR